MNTETNALDVATEIPAASTEPEATPKDATAAPEDVSKQAEAKTFTQAELDEIVQKRIAKAEAKAERNAVRRERELLERFVPQQATTEQQDARPSRDRFATDDDWVEAVTDWKLAQRDRSANQERQAQTQRATATKTEQIYTEAAKQPGFDRDAFDELPLTPVIAQTIIDSDLAPQLMAHMASHPDDVDRIAKLSPARQAAELGKLEARLSVVKQTKEAPAPIRIVSGSGTVHNNGDPSKMSMDDYMAMRKKQGAGWAR